MAKILIIDDSDSLREDLKKVLIHNGHDVLEANNGRVGIDVLKITNGISLVICDVNMPEMNGIEVCQKIYEDQKMEKVPIVMLTTETKIELKEKAKAFGVKAWVTKPFVPHNLMRGIHKILAKYGDINDSDRR